MATVRGTSSSSASSAATPSVAMMNATRRLTRDLKEVIQNESFLPLIRALPVKENLFLWHANLAGPPRSLNSNVIVHLELQFPHTYPKDPPSVRICNEVFNHPNVFRDWNPAAYGEFRWDAKGNWICVDILKPFVDEIYSGWSTAYTVFSILMQLQSFLFDGDDHYTKIGALDNRTRQASQTHECTLCGHTYTKPWPKVSLWKPEPVKPKPAKRSLGWTPPALQFIIQEPEALPSPNSKGPVVGMETKLTPSQMRNLRRAQARKKKATQNQGKQAKSDQKPRDTKQVSKKAKEKDDTEADDRPAASKKSHHEREASVAHQAHEDKAQKLKPAKPQEQKNQQKDLPKTMVKAPATDSDDTPINSGYFSVLTMTSGQLKALKSTKPQPVASTPSANVVPKQQQKKKPTPQVKKPQAKKLSGFEKLPVEIVGKILNYLDRRGQACAVQVCHLWDYLINYRIISQEMICFHTKLPYTEVTLGIGLNLEYYPVRNSSTGRKRISQITSPLDLISKEAFFSEGVTKSVWKIECTHWMPLFINFGHAKRAGIESYKMAIAKILGFSAFSPWMVLEVIPKLMNTMVVQTMDGSLHTSIVALEGYCAFHRLLLFLADEIPQVRRLAERKVEDFLDDPESRIKRNTNNLGEFLTLLTFTRITWEAIRLPFLLECWDRNVKWMLEKDPSLQNLEPDGTVSKKRLESTLRLSAVSQRLLMFQVYFLTTVARPPGSRLSDVKAAYDRRFGRPAESIKLALQEECKKIRAVSTWPEFFKRLGFTAMPTPSKLCDLLRQSIVNSKKKGYHDPKDYK